MYCLVGIYCSKKILWGICEQKKTYFETTKLRFIKKARFTPLYNLNDIHYKFVLLRKFFNSL